MGGIVVVNSRILLGAWRGNKSEASLVQHQASPSEAFIAGK